MSSSPKMPAEYVRPTAELIARLLAPACEKIAIAGSLRRESPDIGDIEIVVSPGPHFDYRLQQLLLPKPAKPPALFEEESEPPLPAIGDELRCLAWNADAPGDGPRMKKLVATALSLPVELYLAAPENWGNILAIRTGDRDWSEALVTARSLGGFMPAGCRQKGGYLRQGVPGAGPHQDWANLPILACFDEQSFFECLGIPWVEPRDRNARTAYRLGARSQAILNALDIDKREAHEGAGSAGRED